MNLSFIIPTFQREEILKTSISSLLKATEGRDYEVIIVNDDDKPLSTYFYTLKNIIIIQNKGKGVASARNCGAEIAAGDYIVFMDDDIIINSENVNTLEYLVKTYPGAAFNLNWTYPPELTKTIQNSQFGRYLISNGWTSLKGWQGNMKWKDDEIFQCEMLASFFLVISRTAFIELGGYDEIFPLAGAEDFELAQRIKKSDIKTYIYPLSTVWHNEADRNTVKSWLKRKENAAKTRQIAFKMGYREMGVKSSGMKNFLAIAGLKTLPVWFFLLKLIPDFRIFDPVYNKIVNFLMVIYIRKGFTSKL